MRTTTPEKGAALLCKGGTAHSVEFNPDTKDSQTSAQPSIALLGFPETLVNLSIFKLKECLNEAFDELERRHA